MPQARPFGQSVNVYGSNVFFLEAGVKSPLLLLHGMGQSSSSWLRSMPVFSQRHRVLAPDFPGFGRSPVMAGPYDPVHFGQIASGFIQTFGYEQVDAVGSSLGGLALLLAALAHPKLFGRIVLVAPLGFTAAPRPPLDSALLALIGLWLMFPRSEGLIRAGYSRAFFDSNRVDDLTVEEIARRADDPIAAIAARRSVHAIFRFSKHLESFHARLKELAMPVLILWGRNDPVLPWQDARFAYKCLPHAVLKVYERCGHLPHVEQAEKFCADTGKFLVS